MSETFGLTGVDVEQQQKQKQEQQIPKKMVTSVGPKDKKEDNSLKGSMKLPMIEQKKASQLQMSNSNTPAVVNQERPSQLQEQKGVQPQPNNPIAGGKILRAKSSRNPINVRRIDTLKAFIDKEKQMYATTKEEKWKPNLKRNDIVAGSSQLLRMQKDNEKQMRKTAFLEGYKKKIEGDFEQLYRLDDYKNVVAQLKTLENKVKLQGEIKRNEEVLNKDQKEYNQLRYEIEQKQKQLTAINNQIANMHSVFSSEGDKFELSAQEQLHQEYEQRLQNEMLIQLSMQNMMETRKKLMLFEKKKSESMYEEYVAIGQKIHGFEEEQLNNKQKYTNLEKQITHYSSRNAFNLNSRFQELLEDELSEYEDKNALHEIFKHEQERKDGLNRKEQEVKKLEMEQLNFERQKQQDKVKSEQRQVEQILNQKRKNMEELLKVSSVSDISELEERKIFLEASNSKLKRFEQEFQESIDKQKAEITQLRKELNELKYIQKESQKFDAMEQIEKKKNHLQVIDEVNLTANVNIEKFEQILIEETDHMQDKEYQVKRLERVVDEITLVFSRILYQLQPPNQKTKNIEVKREDLRNQITICGLKLEKIISFLAKKKDSLRVESINTDADNVQPPEYVGLNPKNYVRQRDLDEQREFKENIYPKFQYKEDDPDEFEADKYLLILRSKIHKGTVSSDDGTEDNILNRF